MDGQPQSIEPDETAKNGKRKRGKPLTTANASEIGKLGGRPKKLPKSPLEIVIEEECRKYTQEALQVWIDALRGEDVPWTSKLKAAENIIDRGYGKALENVNVNHSLSIGGVFAEVVEQINEQRRAAVPGHAVELVAIAEEVCD